MQRMYAPGRPGQSRIRDLQPTVRLMGLIRGDWWKQTVIDMADKASSGDAGAFTDISNHMKNRKAHNKSAGPMAVEQRPALAEKVAQFVIRNPFIAPIHDGSGFTLAHCAVREWKSAAKAALKDPALLALKDDMGISVELLIYGCWPELRPEQN